MIHVKRKLGCLLLVCVLLGSLCIGAFAEESHAAPTITSAYAFQNGIEVEWQYIKGVSSYKLQYRPAGGTWKTAYSKLGARDYAAVIVNAKLESNTCYEIRVGAVYPDDTKTYYSKIATVYYLAPPTGVSLVNTATGLKLTWDAVEGADGYYVYRSTSWYGDYELVKTVKPGGLRQYVNTGRTNGKTYYYYIKAYGVVCGEAVTSAKTEEVGGVRLTQPEITACDSPFNGTVTLEWTKNTKADYYNVHVVCNGKTTDYKTADYKFTVSGLTPGKTCKVTVQSVQSAKESYVSIPCRASAWSETVSVRVSSKAPAAPDAPQNVQAKIVLKSDDLSCMKISWDAVENATEYRIYYRQQGSSQWKLYGTVQNGATFYAENNGLLKTSGIYDFKVKARIVIGDTVLESGDSEVIHAVNFSTWRFEADAESKTKGKIKVTWSAVDNADGYQIKYIAPDGTVKYKVYYGNVTSGTLSALQSGAQYAVFVRPFHLFDGVRFYSTWLKNPTYVTVK